MSGPHPLEILAFLRAQLFIRIPLPSASFSGQTVIVTGSNSGLGREAARHFVRLGAARVILAVRTMSKGEEAVRYIEQETSRQDVCEVWPLDMASFESVKAFAKQAEGLERLDALVLNAGISPAKFESAEGYEATVTVNVIATFLLYHLLLPTMRRSASAHQTVGRATVVGSTLHKFSTFKARRELRIFEEFKKVIGPKEFDDRYIDSKLLVMLYGREVAQAQSWSAAETDQKSDGAVGDVLLNFVSPGWCKSNLRRGDVPFAESVMGKFLLRSTDAGAAALVDAVRLVGRREARERHGVYVDDLEVKRVSRWLESTEGKQTANRVWKELNEILEEVQEGITKGL